MNKLPTAQELSTILEVATTKETFEAICKQIVNCTTPGELIGPAWLLKNAFFKHAGKFYPSLTTSELSNKIQRQIEENIFAPARALYPKGIIKSAESYDMAWAYDMCFLNHMQHLCRDMESFIINYCNEKNDSANGWCFHIIPLHIARFLSSVDAYTIYGSDDDFNVTAYRCRAFCKGTDIYIYIPEPAEHSRHVAVMTMECEAKKLRKGSYNSTVSLQKGDDWYNTIDISKNKIADNIDALSAFLSTKYPNATWKIISHSDYRELPNICQDAWNNRFKRTTISRPTGFRLSVVEYSPTNMVAYIVLPKYH